MADISTNSINSGAISRTYVDNSDGTWSERVVRAITTTGTNHIKTTPINSGAIPSKYQDNGDGTFSKVFFFA